MSTKNMIFIFLLNFCAISRAKIELLGIRNEFPEDSSKTVTILSFRDRRFKDDKFPLLLFLSRKINNSVEDRKWIQAEMKKNKIRINTKNINIFDERSVPYKLNFKREIFFIPEEIESKGVSIFIPKKKDNKFLFIKIGGKKWYSVVTETKNNNVNFIFKELGNTNQYISEILFDKTEYGVWFHVKQDGTLTVETPIIKKPINSIQDLLDYLEKNKTTKDIGQKIVTSEIGAKGDMWNKLLGNKNTTELMSELWKGNLDKAREILESIEKN